MKEPFCGSILSLVKILFSFVFNSLLYATQRVKKVVSDSPGPVDFATVLVIFVLNLPDGQVLFFGEIQITEGL